MVKITEDMIRKRAEHNECIISTLEEISLHQQDIEKIEFLDKWCRDLKILYLQSNLIPKIENVGRLKKLEYLNLALNNIERVENLEACESLHKLDLTVNFVGELTSIENLKGLYNLRDLYLTGNPCTDFMNYREYTIATLPQLTHLDGIEIERSERIQATQILHQTRPSIIEQQRKYRRKREQEKAAAEAKARGEAEPERKGPGFDGNWYTDIDNTREPKIREITDEEAELIEREEKQKSQADKDKEFWEETVPFTPESRVAVHEYMEKQRKRDEKPDTENKKRERKLMTDDGRILNINEAGIDFTLDENDEELLLDLHIFRHMDTSLCDVDVHPTYFRGTFKGKIFQLVLPEEVKPDSSCAKRSQTTGHLLISMPKMNPVIKPKPKPVSKGKENRPADPGNTQGTKHEHLEVDPSKAKCVDISNIVEEKATPKPLGRSYTSRVKEERPNSIDFVDDPDVPPLI